MASRLSRLLLWVALSGSAATAASPTVREAVALTKAGQHAEALKILDEIVRAHPDNGKVRLFRAKSAYLAGKPEIATRELALLARDPVVGTQATALLRRIRARLAAAASPSPGPSPSADAAPSPAASPSASLPAPSPSASPAIEEPAGLDYGNGHWRLGMSQEEFAAGRSEEQRVQKSTDSIPLPGGGRETRIVLRPSVILGQPVGESQFFFDEGGTMTGAVIYHTGGKRDRIDERCQELRELFTQAYSPPHEASLRKEQSNQQVKFWIETTLWSYPQVPVTILIEQHPAESDSPDQGEVWLYFGTKQDHGGETGAVMTELVSRPPLPREPEPSPEPEEPE